MKPEEIKTFKEFYESLFRDILDKDYSDMPEGNPNGGPKRKYRTPKDLAKAAIDYFVFAESRRDSLRLTAFILHTYLTTRQGFYKYETFGSDFPEVVRRIKCIIEDYNVQQIYTPASPGAKFVLQCGFDWIPTEKKIIDAPEINVSIGKKE